MDHHHHSAAPAAHHQQRVAPSPAASAVLHEHSLPLSPSDCVHPTTANGFGHHTAQKHSSATLSRVKSFDNCRVCGDGPARMHYGVPTCFGCKGFFRRTLKRTKEYTCRYSGNCVVDRYERNSCRFCRFKRCLEVGMDPKAVRPDRDAAGRTHPIRRRVSRNAFLGTNGELPLGDSESAETGGTGGTDEWIRKLPVEMRTLLIQFMNIDATVSHGDANEKKPTDIYPLPFHTLRQMFEDPGCLDGKRTEIRYEPYRQVEPDELAALAHRRLVATVDTIEHFCALMDLHNIKDRLTLVKAAFAPLTLFCAVSSTARVTRNRDILCLCNFGYVPRGAHLSYAEPYHFSNRLVDRALDELVEPFRTFNFKEQEIVLMKAIVALNPYLPNLSAEAAEQVADFRDRVQETLYNVVRESHPKEVASSRFGNLLLFLPNIMLISSIMTENLQFIQSFGHKEIGPLLSELLEEDNDETDEVGTGGGEESYGTGGMSSEESMRHSQSTSSICSMTSSATTSGELFWQHIPQQDNAMQRQFSTGQLVDIRSDRLNSRGSVPQQMSQNDSDPDYNTTLTAETLKQAIQQQQMEVDSPADTGQKPQFFIDPSAPLIVCQQSLLQRTVPSTTVASTKHVFTVEKAVVLGPPAGQMFLPQSVGGGGSAPDFGTQKQHQMAFGNFNGIAPGINSSNPSMASSSSSPHIQQRQHQQMNTQPALNCTPIEEECGGHLFGISGRCFHNSGEFTPSGGANRGIGLISKTQSYPFANNLATSIEEHQQQMHTEQQFGQK
ncbi:hypothetical protein niasHT_007330 [Heterodera trifolii]|uniref:Uncharacterized protein n=1 Tax=Heterodera trifolii TaxID=157864 RepID=A0ABD2LLB4_9BILA